ncbi:hypothetical protein SKAU_G00162860 [Synaphobranchus kaupii]|uniref:Uncharacterized protein n=1 Tax=Synaphobranchus kaupii TaxID=118154 RepID=A0A9Q1IZ21_SYNKA|nr:hypothetical protein SKAU_G00162860 [Synaphobranchus kaupii]
MATGTVWCSLVPCARCPWRGPGPRPAAPTAAPATQQSVRGRAQRATGPQRDDDDDVGAMLPSGALPERRRTDAGPRCGRRSAGLTRPSRAPDARAGAPRPGGTAAKRLAIPPAREARADPEKQSAVFPAPPSRGRGGLVPPSCSEEKAREERRRDDPAAPVRRDEHRSVSHARSSPPASPSSHTHTHTRSTEPSWLASIGRSTRDGVEEPERESLC